MSDFEMNAMDMEVEAVANNSHKPASHAAAVCVDTGTEQPRKGFWNRLDDDIHYKRFRRTQLILAVVRILVCILAAAALIAVMYIPEMLPYVVNIGVAACIVAGSITLDRAIARWRI